MSKVAFIGLIAAFNWGQLESQVKMDPIQVSTLRMKEVSKITNRFKVESMISGKKYQPGNNEVNSRYFKSDTLVRGAISYNGVHFTEMRLQYDLLDQQIIVSYLSGGREELLSLDIDRIQSFTLAGFKFVNYPGSSIMPRGIYQIGFNGVKSQLFIKRIKVGVRTIRSGKLEVTLTPKNIYYLVNESGVFLIRNKKDFVHSYKPVNLIMDIISSNKIKFSKKNFEEDLINAISLVDSINY